MRAELLTFIVFDKSAEISSRAFGWLRIILLSGRQWSTCARVGAHHPYMYMLHTITWLPSGINNNGKMRDMEERQEWAQEVTIT